MSATSKSMIYSIGHSNLPVEAFIALLKDTGIEAVADVRSIPWSRHNPQFNRETLKASLRSGGIEYSWLGNELGGRPTESQYFCDGVADYRKMVEAPHFRAGLERVARGAKKYRLALMCAEQDPVGCHRCLLVSRALRKSGHAVTHLLHDGRAQSQEEIEQRLLTLAGIDANDLFSSPEERIDLAYRRQNLRGAFTED